MTLRDEKTYSEVGVLIVAASAAAGAARRTGELAAQLAEYTGYLNQQLHGAFDFGNIIGDSGPLREVLQKVEQVAPTDSTVLIEGETGTGKDLISSHTPFTTPVSASVAHLSS